MASKRPAGKDFDTPPPQAKQPRVEGGLPLPQRPSSSTSQQPGQAFIFPSQSLTPVAAAAAAVAAPHPLMPPQTLGSPSAPAAPPPIIGIAAGILPTGGGGVEPSNSGSFELPHGIQGAARPRVLPLPVAGVLQTSSHGASNLSPFSSHTPLGLMQQQGTTPTGITPLRPRFPTMLGRQSLGLVSSVISRASPLVAGSPVTTPSAPPPPYPIPTISSDTTLEEFTCSSPSQFLHPPTSFRLVTVSQAASTSTATAGSLSAVEKDGRRQPVCISAPPVKSSAHTASGLRNSKALRGKVLKHKHSKIAALKLKFTLLLKEKFFLEGGGNLIEFVMWKKKPNILRDQYLKQHDLDAEAMPYDDLLSPKDIVHTRSSPKMDILALTESKLVDTAGRTTPSQKQTAKDVTKQQQQKTDAMTTTTTTTPPTITTTTNTGYSNSSSTSSSPSSTMIQIPLATASPGSLQVSGANKSAAASPSPSSRGLHIHPTPSPRPATRSHASFNSAYESSHEDIVMRARHEAEVMKAISELRKEGLWSASRLPKVKEPARKKTHWDYLLEEMQWLATDFANEKRWQINAAKKVFTGIQYNYMCTYMYNTCVGNVRNTGTCCTNDW